MTNRWTMTRMGGAVALALLITLTGFGARAAIGQETEEGFPLPIVAAFCEELPTVGPFQGGGCVPGEGAYFEVTTEGGELLGSCTAESADVEGPPAASCTIDVPFGSTVVVWLDESTIPTGYALHSPNPQTVNIPSGPPEGQFGGAVFIALLQATEDDGSTDESGEIGDDTTLPNTGIGNTITQGSGLFWPLAAAGALALMGIGVTRRRTT